VAGCSARTSLDSPGLVSVDFHSCYHLVCIFWAGTPSVVQLPGDHSRCGCHVGSGIIVTLVPEGQIGEEDVGQDEFYKSIIRSITEESEEAST